jgi:phosphatidylserine decarboxylase
MKIPHYPHSILAKEGWSFIALIILISILSFIYLGSTVFIFCLICATFIIQFFRDPKRALPQDFTETSVVSPADGKIVFIGKELNPYTNEYALKISVFMNIFNVHSNRCPIEGKIQSVHYFEGKFFNAAIDKASLENERNAIVLHTKNGVSVTFVQIAGLVARRIVCYKKAQDNVYVGERYGFIRFGSRVDVYLPLSSLVKVQLGQKVSATSTLLAELK